MDESEDLFGAATAAQAAGEAAAAERLYRRLLARSPGDAAAWRALGELLRRAGRAEQARAAGREACRLEAEALIEEAAGFLAQRLTAEARPLVARAAALDPESARAAALAADVARLSGDYAAALDQFRRLRALEPASRRAQRGAALFAGEPPPAAPAGEPLPTCFARWTDWLPAARRDEVVGYALAHRGEMSDATVWQPDGYGAQPGVRQASVLYEPAAIKGWFEPLLRRRLPEVCRRLGLAPFEPGQVELQLTFHGDGGFYDQHRDTGWPEAPAEETDRRRVSFVAYFARRPRRFSGGELVLFDTDPASGQAVLDGTLVEPEDNSVVFFPSLALHEVRPIRLDSADPADGRITLNGWIHHATGRAPDYR